MGWMTEDQLTVLQNLTNDGHTAKEIAARASVEFGRAVTKNSIIGLWNRGSVTIGDAQRNRNMKGRPRTDRPRRTRQPRAERQIKARKFAERSLRSVAPVAPPLPTVDDMMIPAEQRRTLLDLTARTCKWPVGDPGDPDFFFCGGEAVEGRPYCVGHLHRSINYQRVVPFRRRPSRTIFLEAAE